MIISYIPPKKEKQYTIYTSVRLYNSDTNEDYGLFYNFHQVTEFMNTNKLTTVYLKDFPLQKVQHWGLRQWR
jgi:hypothetical protein